MAEVGLRYLEPRSLREMAGKNAYTLHTHTHTHTHTHYTHTHTHTHTHLFPLHFRFSGEGTFGKVVQARAEGIVDGSPERNIVAVKTTKGR